MKYSIDDPILGQSVGSPADVFAWLTSTSDELVSGAVREYVTEIYRLCRLVGIRADLLVAQSAHETDDWSSYWWKTRKNPAGIGITGDEHQNMDSQTWQSGADAARAHVIHMFGYTMAGQATPEVLKPFFVLDRRFAHVLEQPWAGDIRTLKELTGRWATDPRYAEKVVTKANSIFRRSTQEESPVNELRIILNPGHRNTTGGSTEEQQMTPALAQSYFDAFNAAGYEVVNLGDTSGGLDETSRRMAAAIASAPGDCVLLDLHYEGSPAPGVFCIVPDVTGLRTNAPVAQDPNDTWANNTIDRALARAISNRISAATGLTLRTGIREPGIMDESETGVGGEGWRLATFAYTSPHRNKAVRLVVEHGNHGIQPDRGIIFQPDFTDRCAAAAVAAVQAVYGTPETEEPEEPTPAKGPHVPGKINWQRGDVGIGTYKDTPVLQFVMELTATKRTTPRVAASGKAKTCSSAIEVGETRVAIGALDSGWGFLDDGSRIRLDYFSPEVPRPRDAA